MKVNYVVKFSFDVGDGLKIYFNTEGYEDLESAEMDYSRYLGLIKNNDNYNRIRHYMKNLYQIDSSGNEIYLTSSVYTKGDVRKYKLEKLFEDGIS
jgi:hypothetical protein